MNGRGLDGREKEIEIQARKGEGDKVGRGKESGREGREMERQGRQWGGGGGREVEWWEILGPVALNLSVQHTSQPRRRQTPTLDLCGMICLSKCFSRRERQGGGWEGKKAGGTNR